MYRDVPSYASYFGIFEYIKQRKHLVEYYEPENPKQKWLNLFWTMNAGGLAGALSWIIVHPIDIVKTNQQIYKGDKELTFCNTFMKLYREGGFRRLFRGNVMTQAG